MVQQYRIEEILKSWLLVPWIIDTKRVKYPRMNYTQDICLEKHYSTSL